MIALMAKANLSEVQLIEVRAGSISETSVNFYQTTRRGMTAIFMLAAVRM
jgi:hypothetical protein